MRKSILLLSYIASAILLAGCTADDVVVETRNNKFEASFEQPLTTRTYLGDDNGFVEMHWTYGDLVTLIQPSGYNTYYFADETGSTSGTLNQIEAFAPISSYKPERNYAVYPHASGTSLLSEGAIQYEIPSTQTYVPDSFGPGAGLMVAVTEDEDDTQLSFQSAVGYLVLKIYGDAAIKSIQLKGNSGEPLSGNVIIEAVYGQEPVLAFHEGAGKKLTLDCGDGVMTGATEEDATTFWLAVAPTDFSAGFTITVIDTLGVKTEQVTTKPVSILRNVYQPMAPFLVEAHDVPDLTEVSSNLPVLYIYTPDNTPILDKVNWVEESKVFLKDPDGTITDLGAASIRGRGNTTWSYAKKPYALKLDKKASLLGMPKDKRWDLLANYLDRTRLRNDIALEMGRRLSGLAWTPKGKFVELVLNGVFMGNYYLVEHIKVATDRVNIKEMKSKDIAEPNITGGYLLEMSIEFDEVNKFYTKEYHAHTGPAHLPVMIKDPDEDVMVPAQLDWIRGYVNGVQDLLTAGSSPDTTWRDYVDMDSFIDWMFVHEIVGNGEPQHPKSCYMYKDRGGKLTMGPLWDFDWNTFNDNVPLGTIFNYSLWYGYMRKDPVYKARVKERWPAAREAFREVLQNYIDELAEYTKESVSVDWQMWPSELNVNGDKWMSYDYAVQGIKESIRKRVDRMDSIIEYSF